MGVKVQVCRLRSSELLFSSIPFPQIPVCYQPGGSSISSPSSTLLHLLAGLLQQVQQDFFPHLFLH